LPGALVRARGANPVYQGDQVGAVLVGYRGELQAQAAAGNLMLHDGFGANLSFGNKKINLGASAQLPGDCRGEEQSPHAQIANAGNIFDAFASPADPYVLMGRNARNQSSGIQGSDLCGRHISPRACELSARDFKVKPRGTRLTRTITRRLGTHNPANTLSVRGIYLLWAAVK